MLIFWPESDFSSDKRATKAASSCSHYFRASSTIFIFLRDFFQCNWVTVKWRMKRMWHFKSSSGLVRRPKWNESDAMCRSLTKHRSRWWRRRPSETLVTSSGRGEDLCLPFGSNQSHICLSSCQSLNRVQQITCKIENNNNNNKKYVFF